jgi:hypothetical protein
VQNLILHSDEIGKKDGADLCQAQVKLGLELEVVFNFICLGHLPFKKNNGCLQFAKILRLSSI